MFNNIKMKAGNVIGCTVLFLFVFAAGCSKTGLDSDQLPDARLEAGFVTASAKGQNGPMSSPKGISKLIGDIGIPVNPTTGAYRACLTAEGRTYWRERLAGTNLKGLYNNWGFGSDKQGGWLPAMGVDYFNGLAKNYTAFLTSIVAIPATALMGQSRSFPFCGNWCGPGHPRDGENPPAVDMLDAVCRLHDLCYNKYGNKSCKCDQMLLDAISISRPVTQMSKLEYAIMAYFGNSQCIGGCKIFGVTKTCDKGLIITGDKDVYRHMTERPNLLKGCGESFKEVAQCKVR